MPHFECQQPVLAAFTELVRNGQGIRSLLVVIEHVMTTDCAHLIRIADAQTPARNVQFVNALVSEIAIAVIPEPMPVIVKTVFGERVLWRRAKPLVIMNSSRNRL